MLGHSDIGFLISRCGLRFLLLLCRSLLESLDIAVVDVGGLLWVLLGCGGGSFGFLMNLVCLAVEHVNLILDQLLKDLSNCRLDNGEQEWLEDVEQQLMFRLLQLDVEALHININFIDLEEVLAVALVSSFHGNLECEASASHEDIHDTSILDGWEALLLVDVVADILQVHLNTRYGDHDLILVLVGHGLSAPTEVVIAAKFEGVGRQVVALNDKVLNNSVNHRISVLNTRHRDVAHTLKDTWDDDVAEVLEKVRLECRLAVLIVAKLVEKSLHGLTKLLVLWILIKLITDEFEFIDHAVGVVTVTIAEEEAAFVVQLVPLLSSRVLQNEALLLKGFTDILVDVAEPALEFGVFVGITVHNVDGFNQIISRSRVGEALEECL